MGKQASEGRGFPRFNGAYGLARTRLDGDHVFETVGDDK